MKTYEQVIERILEIIDKAVHCSSEDDEKYLMATAVELGWVVGVAEDEIKSIYEGEYTKEFILKHGRDSGILG